MKTPITKLCRVCGEPVIPTRRKDRRAYYYPLQCKKCFRKDRNQELTDKRRSLAMKGMNHPNAVPLFTESVVDRRGYKYVKIKISEKGKWPYKHRWMMEQFLGRKLNKNEIVHHINGNTLDNRLDNFQLMLLGEHTTHHQSTRGWSRKYDSCRLCGTTTKKHEGYGLCTTCYQRHKNL